MLHFYCGCNLGRIILINSILYHLSTFSICCFLCVFSFFIITFFPFFPFVVCYLCVFFYFLSSSSSPSFKIILLLPVMPLPWIQFNEQDTFSRQTMTHKFGIIIIISSLLHDVLINYLSVLLFVLSVCSLFIAPCVRMLCCFCNCPFGCWLGTLINTNWIIKQDFIAVVVVIIIVIVAKTAADAAAVGCCHHYHHHRHRCRRLCYCPSLLHISGISFCPPNVRNSLLFTVTCKDSFSARCVSAANLVCRDVDYLKEISYFINTDSALICDYFNQLI